MAAYKNDYKKEEDEMMWELHEIRKKMAAEKLTAEEINAKTSELLKKYDMEKLSVNEEDVKYGKG